MRQSKGTGGPPAGEEGGEDPVVGTGEACSSEQQARAAGETEETEAGERLKTVERGAGRAERVAENERLDKASICSVARNGGLVGQTRPRDPVASNGCASGGCEESYPPGEPNHFPKNNT